MIYILLPVFNEDSNLEPLFKKIKAGMQRRGLEYQIIAYNDGSTDQSAEILNKSLADYPLRIIGKTKNEGLGYAFHSLLKEVVRIAKDDNDIAVVQDSDNSHNPEHIFHMEYKIRDGFDLVVASRYLTDSRIVGVSAFRQFLSYGASWLMRILFPMKGVRDYTCGFRAYRIALLKKAFQMFGDHLIEEKGFACMAELLVKLRSMNILAVEVPLVLRYDQKGGASKMNIIKTVKNTIVMLVRLKKIPKNRLHFSLVQQQSIRS